MVVKVKHELPPQMAQNRIKQLLETAVKEHAGLISTHDFIWNGNSCDILLSAMKMQFKGNLVVHKDNVQVDLRIPLIFYGYQSKIKMVIEDELNKILK